LFDRRVFARDGSGGYSLPYPTFTNGTTADADQVTANNTDIAVAIAASIAKDGQTSPTANLPMGNYKHTGVADATARTHYAAAGQVQDSAFTWCGTAGGTQNALTFTPTPAISAYAAGQCFVGVIGASSTNSTVTLAVSGLTTKAVQINGSALSSSVVLESGKLYRFDYDGTAFQATRLSHAPAVDGPASATDLDVAIFDGTTGKLLKDSGTTVAGIKGIDQQSKSADYTLVLGDAGKHVYHPAADTNNRTFTIPANSSVAYPIGTAVTFVNEVNTVTIAITSDTMTLQGSGSTGSRTLAANGIATALKVASTKWVISGVGLT
jgi:hypothetical protein